MGSISGRFSGLGSAINNSIARVGQPLLGALIFIAISATYYASLGSTAGLDTGDPAVRAAFQPLNPPAGGATAEQVAASNQASIEAYHLAMLVCAGLLAIGGAGRLVRPARGCGCRGDVRRTCRAGRLTPPMTTPAVTRDWDARTYDRVADPQTRWGTAVLERLPLDGDERVLDAGCGSGRVTELLANRLPRGRVVALDGSPSMIDAARERLAPFGDRIEYVVADLGQPLPIDGTVDAILSTATFHWVPDHDALFRNLAAVLRPGGRLVAQCGGYGNIESVKRVLATIGDGWLGPAHYETPMATVRRLDAAGFVDIECWLTDEPTRFEPGEPLETFMRTVILAPNLERLPPDEHAAFVHEVASRLPEPLIDYVRLNIVARRSSR